MRRILCLFGIHHWSVPKKFKEFNVLSFGEKVGEVTTMVMGCTVPGCCKMKTFNINCGDCD